MVQQIEITLQPKRRGFHLVTSEILSQLPKLPKTGIVNIFTKHTSCGLSINENCDPDVRVDMETIFNRLVPENRPEYEHTLEGADDMPAHAKSTLSGATPVEKSSDHYFFKLPNFGEYLQKWTRDEGRLPVSIANKLDEWFEAGLSDWDISRDDARHQPPKYL